MTKYEDLVEQFRLRGLLREVRAFFEKRGLGKFRGWSECASRLQSAVASGEVDDALLLRLFRDLTMFSTKRVFALRDVPEKPEALGDEKPRDYADWPSVGAKARRPKTLPSYYVGAHKAPKTTVHVYATIRYIQRLEDVPHDKLNKAAQKEYVNATLKARFGNRYRCFDYLVIRDGRAFFLLDTPPGIGKDTVSSDYQQYRDLLAPTNGVLPFFDLWDAVTAIYQDKKDGIINYVEFLSNNESRQSGEYASQTELDYRQNEFHKGGSATAIVKPYMISARWLDGPGKPYARLPGTRKMLSREKINDVWFPPLTHFDLPFHTTEPGFWWAVDRVTRRIKP